MATYTLAATGNWNSAATWGGAGFPIAGDTANITGNFTLTVNVASACAIINFTGFTGTLTVNNSLTVTGNITFVNGFTVNTTSGTPVLVKTTGGTLTMPAAGFTWPHAINFAGGSTYTLSTGDLTVNGTVTGTGSGTATINGAGRTLNVRSVTATAAFISGSAVVKFNQTGGTWSGTISSTNAEIAIAATASPDLTLTNARKNGGTLTYTSGNMGVQSLTLYGTVSFVNISSVTFDTLTVGLAGNVTTLTADGNIACTTFAAVGTNVAGTTTINSNTATTYTISCSSLSYTGAIASTTPTYSIILNGTGTVTPSSTTISNMVSVPITINSTGTITMQTWSLRARQSITYVAGSITQTHTSETLYFFNDAVTLDTSGVEWNSIRVDGNAGAALSMVFTLNSDLRVRDLVFANNPNSNQVAFTNNGGDVLVSGNLRIIYSSAGNAITVPASGTSASINMIGNGTISMEGVSSGTPSFHMPLIINTPGKYTITSTITSAAFANFFIKTGTFTHIKGKVEVTTGTILRVVSAIVGQGVATFTDIHRIPFDTVNITSGYTVTMNEFFCGRPGRYCKVIASAATNYTVTFSDTFQKVARFVRVANATFSNRGVLIIMSREGFRNTTTIGALFFEGSCNGIPKRDPIAYQPSLCFGISDSPADPNFF